MFKITQQMRIKMNRAVLVVVEDTVRGYLQAFHQNIMDHTEMVVSLCINEIKYYAIKQHLCMDFQIPNELQFRRAVDCGDAAGNTIIIGNDCYHSTLHGRGSIAGFVASTKKQMTRWFSRCIVQDQRQDCRWPGSLYASGAAHMEQE
ncbi:unnamed protein product [Ranitomeya imitator]|uniref:Piwi domain-containing protein n=1 Tax=Ranitomeya imitator TaxID=111125 RepID=A0ABN9L9H4_9NEOB|nr:unnamed protein product [Ranitomeya imitator]